MAVVGTPAKSCWEGLQSREIAQFASHSSLVLSRSWEWGCTQAHLQVQEVDGRIVAVPGVQEVHAVLGAVVEIEEDNVMVAGPDDVEVEVDK